MIPWVAVENALHAWVVAGSGLPATEVIHADQDGPRPPGVFASIAIAEEEGVGTDWVDVVPNPLVLADDVVESINAGTDTLTLTAHAYLTGDGPIQLTTDDTLPGGLALATNYWAIKTGANTIKLAASLVDANDAVAVDITSAGVGTHTVVDTPSTRRAGAEIRQVARGPRIARMTVEVLAADATGVGRALAILGGIRSQLILQKDDLAAAGVSVLRMLRARSIGSSDAGAFEPRGLMEITLSLASEVERTNTYIERVVVTNEVSDPDTTVVVSLPSP